MKRLFVFTFVLPFVFACGEDDPVKQEPVVPVVVNFTSTEVTLIENSVAANRVTIQFSAAAPASGTIAISFESEHAQYVEHFLTEPALQNGKINLVINKGQTEASFTVHPVSNPKLHNHKTLTFSITEASGGVTPGETRVCDLTINDAQLVNKLHTITVPGFFFSKRTFEYNEDGQIAKIYWEAKAPLGTGTVSGADTYHYNATGQLERTVRGAYTYNYIHEAGKLVRHETVSNNVIINYTLYHYNEADKLVRKDIFVRQSENKYAYSFIDYEYDEQGNLYQDKRYSTFGDEVSVFSTTTYMEYADGYDPSPLIEILAVQEPALKLPVRYSVKSYDDPLQEYNVTYDLRADDLPVERRVTGPNGTQTTEFTYY
jgi:hypothetical protein